MPILIDSDVLIEVARGRDVLLDEARTPLPVDGVGVGGDEPVAVRVDEVPVDPVVLPLAEVRDIDLAPGHAPVDVAGAPLVAGRDYTTSFAETR